MFFPNFESENQNRERKIRQEVYANETYLKERIAKSKAEAQKFPEREKTIAELEEQLNVLQETTKDSHDLVNTLENKKESLISQNQVLRQIYNLIQARMEENNIVDYPELTEEQKNQVQEQMGAFFSVLEEEFENRDISAFQEDLKRIKEEHRRVKNEISILKEVSGDWDLENSVEDAIEEFSNKIGDKQEQFRSFYNIPFSSENPSLIDSPIQEIPTESLSNQYNTDVEAEIRSIKAGNSRNKKIFENQLSFLRHLKEAMLISGDTQRTLKLLSDDIDSLQENGLESIAPLQVPEDDFEDDKSDPVSSIVEDFSDYTKELCDKIPQVAFEDVVNAAEKNFEVSEYSSPKININTHTAINPNIEKLREDIQRAKDAVSIELPEPPKLDKKTEHNSHIVEEEEHNQTELNEIDNSGLDHLLELAQQKLPKKTIQGLFDDMEQAEDKCNEDECNEEEEEEIIEIIPSKETADAINKFHSMIDGISQLKFPTDQILLKPQQVTKTIARVERIDKDSVLRTVEDYLNPQQNEFQKLESQCYELKKKIEKMKNFIENDKVDDDFDDEDIAEYNKKKKSIGESHDEILAQISEKLPIFKSKKAENRKLSAEIERLESNNPRICKMDINDLRQELERRKSELARVKENAKQEIESYRQLKR